MDLGHRREAKKLTGTSKIKARASPSKNGARYGKTSRSRSKIRQKPTAAAAAGGNTTPPLFRVTQV